MNLLSRDTHEGGNSEWRSEEGCQTASGEKCLGEGESFGMKWWVQKESLLVASHRGSQAGLSELFHSSHNWPAFAASFPAAFSVTVDLEARSFLRSISCPHPLQVSRYPRPPSNHRPLRFCSVGSSKGGVSPSVQSRVNRHAAIPYFHNIPFDKDNRHENSSHLVQPDLQVWWRGKKCMT